MEWQQIASTLLNLGLPVLGNALLPGIGGVGGKMVASAIAGALGVEPTPEAVGSAMATTDPDVVKAKLADLESARQAELATYQAQLADVQNARGMEVAAVHEDHWTAAMPVVITALNFSIALGVVVAVAMGWLREDGIIVGFGIGAYTASNNFWVGSSAGSKRNADTVRAIASNANSPSANQLAGQMGDALGKAVRR